MKKLLLFGWLVVLPFLMKAQTITTGTISPTSYCPGSPVSVPFTITGTFNAGNQFKAELSDAAGNFAAGVNIGQIASTGSGTINGFIPVNAAPGVNYRIRVTSTNPVLMGTDNGTDLSIGAAPLAPAISAGGPTTICAGNSVDLTANSPERGTALLFDGGNDVVKLLYPTTFNPSAYTIEAWVQPMSTANQNLIVLTNSSGPGSQWSHQLRISGGKFQHYLFDGGLKTTTGTTDVVAGQWYHVAAVATSGGQMLLYVNGVQEGTPTGIGTLWGSGNQFWIGSNSSGYSHFNGKVDEARIFTAALPQPTIQNWMGSPVSAAHPNYASLHSYLMFNEGTGNTALDSETNINATLENGPAWASSDAFNYSIAWSPAAGLSSTSSEMVTASPASTTTYQATVTNSSGCSNSEIVTVTVIPEVAASASPATIVQGNSSTLEVTNVQSGTSYTWTGADLSATTGASVMATPTAAGTYTYTVTADDGTCTSTEMVVVTVQSNNPPCTTAMNGTYTINPAMITGGTNFQSFAAAVTALQTIGVCAPVVMQVSAGTYTTPFVLGAIPGTSATNTVTFEGNGATISGCQGNALVSLTHTKHVTISNLTLAPTCDVIGIRLGGSIENVTLSGNTVNLLSTALSTNKSIGILVDAPTGSVSLLNNTIRNGFVGMWARNTTAPITIEGNKLYNAYAYGILLQNLMADRDPAVANSGVLVNSNRVRMRSTAHPNAQGIRANYIGGGFMMNSNYINRSPLMAINLANANQAGTVRAEVINNRMGGDAPNSSGGIGIYNVDNLDLLHNSIVGETRILLSENLDVRNNSFVSVDASQYAYMGATVSNSYLQLNNNYYANTATNGNFVGVETLYMNMTQLQQGYQGVVTYNQNSIGGMGYPYTDSLRITNGSPLFNAGVLTSVVVDFEGQARPDGAGVDIGADEFVASTPPRFAAATLSADVYPNPFQNNLTVKLHAAEAGNVQVVLSDLMGRQIMSRSYTTEAGITELSVGVEQQLSQGVYLLQVTQGGATSTFRVVKQ